MWSPLPRFGINLWQFAEKLEIGRAMRNIRIQSLMVANLSCVAQTGLESMLPIGTPRKPFSANCSEMSALEYYHVELDTHEVIYAEGALVESYDGWNRDNFSNFMEYERLYGAEHHPQLTPFAPILRYHNRRQELNGLVRSLISEVVDVRDPIQIAYDELAQRTEAMLV